MPSFAVGNNCDCLKAATVCIMCCFHNYRVFLLFDTQPVRKVNIYGKNNSQLPKRQVFSPSLYETAVLMYEFTKGGASVHVRRTPFWIIALLVLLSLHESDGFGAVDFGEVDARGEVGNVERCRVGGDGGSNGYCGA